MWAKRLEQLGKLVFPRRRSALPRCGKARLQTSYGSHASSCVSRLASSSTSGVSLGFRPSTRMITTLARWWIVPISMPGRSPLRSRISCAALRVEGDEGDLFGARDSGSHRIAGLRDHRVSLAGPGAGDDDGAVFLDDDRPPLVLVQIGESRVCEPLLEEPFIAGSAARLGRRAELAVESPCLEGPGRASTSPSGLRTAVFSPPAHRSGAPMFRGNRPCCSDRVPARLLRSAPLALDHHPNALGCAMGRATCASRTSLRVASTSDRWE